MMPPKGLIFTGSGDFKKTGEHYVDVLKELCGLMPDHRVLDIGCGIGRIAIPLTKYLSAEGSYEGFDIVKKGIGWCKKNITASFPNFRFLHFDLRNDLYNKKTERPPKEFVFPFEDNSFDQVVLISVFTHMMPDDAEHYLKEIRRVLKPKGKCLVTNFILNPESRVYMKTNPGFRFDHNFGNYSLMDKNVKEANIAFEEEFMISLINGSSLIVENTLYGYWSGRQRIDSFDFQDIMILSKKKI